jgi:hypothetical protein
MRDKDLEPDAGAQLVQCLEHFFNLIHTAHSLYPYVTYNHRRFFEKKMMST